jgi:hypothetical protein
MDAPTQLWEAWREQVKQLFPHLHGHQQKTLAWMVLGVVLSGSAVLQRMAEGLYGISAAKMPSIERRLARFVANDRMQVSPVWTTFLTHVLPFWRERRVFLILDCTPFDDRATIVYVGLLVQSRVLPLAWQVMPAQDKWPEGQWDVVRRLFDQIAPHLAQADCTLLADRGLVGWSLVHLCRERHWHYLLRVRREHTCRRWMGRWTAWQRLGQVITKPGQQWYGKVQLWQEQTVETQLSAVWEPAHQDSWLLISDRPAGRQRIGEYAWRTRVEATFLDSKSRGWKLEASRIADRSRLDRLLLVLFLGLWWITHLAAACLHHGKRHLFDRHDRRAKGIFRLGRLWLLDILRRAKDAGTLLRCLPFQRQGTTWHFALRF